MPTSHHISRGADLCATLAAIPLLALFPWGYLQAVWEAALILGVAALVVRGWAEWRLGTFRLQWTETDAAMLVLTALTGLSVLTAEWHRLAWEQWRDDWPRFLGAYLLGSRALQAGWARRTAVTGLLISLACACGSAVLRDQSWGMAAGPF